MGNNPIPPRSRALCFADSPRHGEYGSLGARLRRGKVNNWKAKFEIC
jgi:hypothetical protein